MADEMEGLKIIGEIQHVRLQPDDVIVVTVTGRGVSEELAARIQQQVARVFPGHRCLILDSGLRMEVARREKVDG